LTLPELNLSAVLPLKGCFVVPSLAASAPFLASLRIASFVAALGQLFAITYSNCANYTTDGAGLSIAINGYSRENFVPSISQEVIVVLG